MQKEMLDSVDLVTNSFPYEVIPEISVLNRKSKQLNTNLILKASGWNHFVEITVQEIGNINLD